MKKQFIIVFLLITLSSFAQSLNENSTIINDSCNYYLEIGLYHKEEKKSYKKAIEYTEIAMKFAKSKNNTEKLGDAFLQLGTIYSDLEKNNLAIDYLIRALNSYDKKNPKTNLAFSYYNLGKCYLKKNNIKIAEIYFAKAAVLYEKLDFKEATEFINLQKGIIKKENKNYEEATSLLTSVINNLDDETFISTKSEAYFQLGEINLAQKKYQQAIVYYNLAENINKNIKSDFESSKKIVKQLSIAHEKNNNTQKSHYYLKKYAALSDSISKHIMSIESENTIDKIQFDEQLKTIELLDKEKKIQQKTLRFSKLIGFLSIALIIILSLLSYSLYKNNKIRNYTNILLEEKNKELVSEKEKAEFAYKARAEFLSTVSHELRTPLNAINGITYLLLQDKPKENQLNYLKSLEFSGNYLLHFINDILEINRLESNKVIVEKIHFDLKKLIENITTSFNEFIAENNINFYLTIDETIPNNLKGDPTKLSQIIINLLNNAIKFTKNGSVWFTIKKISETNSKLNLNFEIKDNGIGIPENQQKTIFESFSQGSVEINRNYGGTGLGLSIVKKVLEILGSTIHLKSESGKGSTFSFELDFVKSTKIESEIYLKPKNENLNQKNILLVEDNKINQMITKKMLEKKGILCDIIDNGEDSIELVKSKKYDLVLMDIHLPGINGTEATTAIRKFDLTTPIIALTAISLNENRKMLMSFGMNEVITKPFEPEHFFNVVTSYLSNKKQSNF